MSCDNESNQEYRRLVTGKGFTRFSVRVAQTDLLILAEKDLTQQAYDLVLEGRQRIEEWAADQPGFLISLKPLSPAIHAPKPVKAMLEAGRVAGVGPMAAVAGALAEFVGQGLHGQSPSGVVVENGGDVYLHSTSTLTVGLFAGASALSMKLGLEIAPGCTPIGICTSSGNIGHSVSFGRADAATVVGDNTALADASATALGNRIRSHKDMEEALEWVVNLPGIRGAAAMVDEKFGFIGDLNIISLS